MYFTIGKYITRTFIRNLEKTVENERNNTINKIKYSIFYLIF